MLDVKMTDVKLTDQFAGHEIAGHETTGHKRVRYETGSDKCDKRLRPNRLSRFSIPSL